MIPGYIQPMVLTEKKWMAEINIDYHFYFMYILNVSEIISLWYVYSGVGENIGSNACGVHKLQTGSIDHSIYNIVIVHTELFPPCISFACIFVE